MAAQSGAARARCVMTAMARAVLWGFGMSLVVVVLSWYLDTPVPDEIPEKLKVKVIDASMRTYRHLMDGLVRMGVTSYFSPLDRRISDWFILTQMTGQPWGMKWQATPGVRMNDTEIDGVRVIIYEPVSTIRHEERPVLIFMHGGGWSLLSVDSYDPLMRKLAQESGVVIISVNYRLSPEHPYPAPLDDCVKVVNYVTDNADDFRLDPYRVAVGGDSAGGNMAAAISLKLRDKIAMQFLIVPCLQVFNFKTTSFVENTYYFRESINNPGSVVFITNYLGISPEHVIDFLENNHTSRSLKRSHLGRRVNQTKWMKAEYIRNEHLIHDLNIVQDFGNEELSDEIEERITDPYMAPLMADDSLLKNIAEAYVITCGYDFIRDDGVMYAERLKVLGNSVTHKHYKAGFHHAWLFPQGPLTLNVGTKIVADLVSALKERL